MSHKITRRYFVGLGVAGATALQGGLSNHVAANSNRARLAEEIPGLDEYFQQAIADWKVPGLALAIVRDGKVIVAKGYGVREVGKEATVDESTLFPIASCTKSFTAAMVGKLVDQKKLKWDDPISKHVPSLVIPTLDENIQPTLRHALQHRSGIPNANFLWRTGEFEADEILRRIRFLKPHAAPGAKLVYNNIMYLAAGKAAEHASGKSWGDFITAEFFKPLGMKNSVCFGPRDFAVQDETKRQNGLPDGSTFSRFENVAEPHAINNGMVQKIERHCPNVIAPAGGIHSTVSDMARWLIMHMDRGRFDGRELLSQKRVDELHTPVEPPPSDPSKKNVPKAPISKYGLGTAANRTALSHGCRSCPMSGSEL
jgi:CubicO group peptidase (beta-lactamase class C family)